MTCRLGNGEVEVPLGIVADLLGISGDEAEARMRSGSLTGVVERGEGEDAGRTRITFFLGALRARLIVLASGEVVQRSCVDFGRRRPHPR